ncbi:MAG: hypothetical protein ABW127_00180 [Candidatus Thiodiazotropha endolucinida]
MKKQLTKVKENKLALAKKEFKQFRKTRQAKQVQQSAPPAPIASPSPPTAAHKILLCSTQNGSLARVDFKLSPSIATGIKATAIKPGTASPSTIQTPDLDRVLLKRKVELASTYNGCPHCGKPTICYCNYCGTMSCASGLGEHHRCPGCQREFPTKPLTDAIKLTGNRERPPQPTMTNRPTKPLPRSTRKALPITTTKALPKQPKGLLPKK